MVVLCFMCKLVFTSGPSHSMPRKSGPRTTWLASRDGNGDANRWIVQEQQANTFCFEEQPDQGSCIEEQPAEGSCPEEMPTMDAEKEK